MMTVNMLAGRARAGRAVILAALAALLLPLLAVPGATPARATSCALTGAGDTNSPFLVKSASDLALVGVGGCGLDDDYEQTVNITMLPVGGSIMSNPSNHTPIGAVKDPTTGWTFDNFTGSYDGGGFTITGLRFIDGDAMYGGLFGKVDGGTLTNIHLVDIVVEADSYAGGLAGAANETTISDSTVKGGSVTAVERVGGLVGLFTGKGRKNEALIDNSHTSVVVTVTAGGSEASGGGLAGKVDYSFILNSSATGDVIAEEEEVAVGGLIGWASESGIVFSFATGDVSATKVTDVAVGGLVGYNETSFIYFSFATGDVTNGAIAGGLVGINENSELLATYASGDVAGAVVAGGLTGLATGDGSLFDGESGPESTRVSYSRGAVNGAGDVGGLIGKIQDKDKSEQKASFWDTVTSNRATSAGDEIGRTTAQMTDVAIFADATLVPTWLIVAGWVAFDEGTAEWGICPAVNDGYPFLLWQFTTNPCGASSGGTDTDPVPAAPSFVAPGGVVPALPAGVGAWVQADGSSEPLAVSSPGVNQLRYAADGIEVTFTGGSGSSVSNGLVADANGEVVCEVCVQLAAGQVIEVWMFSTPRLVAAHLTEDLPCQRFSVPVVAPLDGGGPVSAGAHTLQLVLPTASGMQAVNVGVTVGGPVPASVPAGEGSVPSGAALFVLLGAVGVLLAGRRMVTAG